MVLDFYLQYVRFGGQVGNEARRNTSEILDVFRRGVNRGLSANMDSEQKAVCWSRREFYWEGIATGLAGAHAFQPCSENPDYLRFTFKYRQMHFVGYGFWQGLALRYPLPRLNLEPNAWREVIDFAKYRPLLAGGLAFSFLMSRRRMGPKALSLATMYSDDGWEEGILHGLGRALWFLYMQNTHALVKTVSKYEAQSECLIEGIGFAIAYTLLAHPSEMLGAANSFPNSWQPSILRAFGVALVQMVEEDASLLPYIEQIATGPLRDVYKVCSSIAASLPTGSYWYSTYLRRVRAFHPSLSRELGF